MNAELTKRLKTLIETPSPSGFEEPVQALVKKALHGHVDEVSVDVHGNVIGLLNPKGRPRVIVAGHADEIGLMVKYINDQGFVFFQPIGSVPPHRLEGQRVSVLDERGPVAGVIARKRNLDKEELAREVKHHELWIDIGAKDCAAAEARIGVGDPIVLAGGLENLDGDLVMGRGFDDRMGVFVMLEVMRRLKGKPVQAAVYGVSTVQEEAGSRGAWTSGFAITPEVSIVVDVYETSDYPQTDKRMSGDVSLGQGPVLARGTNFNPRLVQLLVETARKNGIPFQRVGTPMPTLTDASVLQIIRGGSAACVVGLPLRYMHTPAEVMSLADVENAIQLLVHAVRRLDPAMDFRPV